MHPFVLLFGVRLAVDKDYREKIRLLERKSSVTKPLKSIYQSNQTFVQALLRIQAGRIV